MNEPQKPEGLSDEEWQRVLESRRARVGSSKPGQPDWFDESSNSGPIADWFRKFAQPAPVEDPERARLAYIIIPIVLVALVLIVWIASKYGIFR